jgi:hypothetical protein
MKNIQMQALSVCSFYQTKNFNTVLQILTLLWADFQTGEIMAGIAEPFGHFRVVVLPTVFLILQQEFIFN